MKGEKAMRVVPSDIVEYILRVFPDLSDRRGGDVIVSMGDVGPYATIVDLLDQVSDSVLPVGQDYVKLQSAKGASGSNIYISAYL